MVDTNEAVVADTRDAEEEEEEAPSATPPSGVRRSLCLDRIIAIMTDTFVLCLLWKVTILRQVSV